MSCVDDLGFSYKYPVCQSAVAPNRFCGLEMVNLLFTTYTDQISVQIVVKRSFPPVQFRNYSKSKCFQDNVAYFWT